MEVNLGLAGVVDLATSGELSDTRDSIIDAMFRSHGTLPLRLHAGDNLTASPSVLDLVPTGVPTGKLWDVRRISVLPPSDLLANVTRVLVFQGNQTNAQSNVGTWSGSDFVTAVQVPAGGEAPSITLSKGQCMLREQEHLWVMILAASFTAGVWFATGSGFEVDDTPLAVQEL